MEGSGHGLILISHVICMEGLKKSMENLCQDSRCLDRNLKPGPPKYKAGGLTTQRTTFGSIC
jgi:hypothetical protein